MSRSLRTHLLSLYVLLAFLSGVAVPALGIALSVRGFRQYQIQSRQENLRALGESLTSLYNEEGRWDHRRVKDILHPAPQWGGMRITLRDAGGRVVHTLSLIQNGNDRHHQGAGPETGPSPLVERSVIPLAEGQLEVERRVPTGRFERDFISYLKQYTFAGAAVMIALACGLGFLVAGGLSRPVVRALERTERIGRGEYELEPLARTGIREMDALSRGVEDLGHSLARQEELRRRLMVDIAHELRTPLAAARAQIEAIADGVWEATPERLSLCVSEMERLGALIEDVESLSLIHI